MNHPAGFISTAQSLGVLNDAIKNAYVHALKFPSEFLRSGSVKPENNSNLALRVILLTKLYFELWVALHRLPGATLSAAIYDAYNNPEDTENFRLYYSMPDFLRALHEPTCDEKTLTISEFLLSKYFYDLSIVTTVFYPHSYLAANLLRECERLQNAGLPEIKSYIDAYISLKESTLNYDIEIQNRDELQRILYDYYSKYDLALGEEEATLELKTFEVEILKNKIRYKSAQPSLSAEELQKLATEKYLGKIKSRQKRRNTLRLKALKIQKELEEIRSVTIKDDHIKRASAEAYLNGLKRTHRKTLSTLMKLIHPEKVAHMAVTEKVKIALKNLYVQWNQKNNLLLDEFSGLTTELLINQINNNETIIRQANLLISFNDVDLISSGNFLSTGSTLQDMQNSLMENLKHIENDYINITLEINSLYKKIEEDDKVNALKNPERLKERKNALLHKIEVQSLLIEKLTREYVTLNATTLLNKADFRFSGAIFDDLFKLLDHVDADQLLSLSEAIIGKAADIARNEGRRDICTGDIVMAASELLNQSTDTFYQKLLN